MNLLALVLLALATFRVSMLITKEDGPFHIFRNLRVYYGRQASKQDTYTPIREFIAELLSCPYCLSIYTAVFLYIMFYVSIIPIFVLAIWGLATLFLVYSEDE